MLLKFFSIVLSTLFLFINGAQAQSDHVDMGARAFSFNSENYLAITFKNDEKWHTYWKNPGDAGLPITLKFKSGEDELKLEGLPWPAPKRYIEQGEMWAYGYSGTYAHFFKLPESVKSSTIAIRGEWLVCKDICIPGSKDLSINLNNELLGENNSHFSKEDLIQYFQNLPKVDQRQGISFFLTKGKKDNQLALNYIIENFDPAKYSNKRSVLTPYPNDLLDFKHEEVYYDKNSKSLYGRFYIDWDGVFEEPVVPLPQDGKFQKPLSTKFLLQYPEDSLPVIVKKEFNVYTLTGNEEFSSQVESFVAIDKNSVNSKPKKETEKNIFLYLLFAFLGGLILNLMPCVLPVISLKLFGLIIHSNESNKQILKHNLFYTLGVLFSFLTLGLVVVLLKTSGSQIGWGFQLQSPTFVFIMIAIILVMALNMLGLFEFITPGGKKLGNAELKKGVGADFVNGILATILSTPCSAPFLGTALTFAFTTSSLNIFLIFTSVGVGLAFPFLLTGIFPSMIRFLPKPGLWMENLKRFLGLSLLLTVVWLYDVYFGLVSHSDVGIYFNSTFALLVFAFYFRKHISKKLGYNLFFFLLPILLFVKTINLGLDKNYQAGIEEKSQVTSGQVWERWNQDLENQKPGQYVFMNFTAKWCLTCKVNKKIVLQSNDFKELVEQKNIKLVEADWTKRDDNITSFLEKYDIVGVPAYFVQKPNGEIISLGETISISKIKKHIP